MLFQVKDNIWFNNDSIKIFTGDDEHKTECITVPARKSVPSVHDENWKPTIIYLAATSCNLKCKYCYADEGTYGIKEEKKQFTFDDYLQTYTKMKELHGGIKAISFFGGEPLLNYREIRKFVEYLHETYYSDEIPALSVNTNGTVLNQEILEFLGKYHFIIGTSVDGTKAIHDENRVADHLESTYDIVKGNLKRFQDTGLNVFVQYTFTRQHLDSFQPGKVEEWCREMEELPINTYELIPVSTTDPRYRLNLEDEETAQKYKIFCEETADYYLDKLLSGDVSKVPRMFMGLVIRLLMQVEQRDCSAGYSFSITPNKKIYPCHTFTEHDEYGVNFSDLHHKSDLDHNVFFVKAKESGRDKNAMCDKCISKKVCGVWCKGLQNNVLGEMNAPMNERCMLMRIYTVRIIRFLAEHYETKKTVINRKLIAYNRLHKELKGVNYES